MKKYVILVLLLVIVVNLAYRIDLKTSPHELIAELMYFPSGIAVRALSVGMYSTLADLVWLRFIQYYGEHRMTDARFDLMYHILDILTTLDTRFLYAYTLGGLMLTHDAERPDQAEKLLKKGMMNNPDDWRYPYMHAFINYVFLRNYEVAKTYFALASRKPNAPEMTKRWEAFVLYKKLGDRETALQLWLDLYTTENPEEREIARVYIMEIKMELDREHMNQQISAFTSDMGRPPVSLRELVTHGYLDSIPTEPHGERFVIRNGKAITTWDRSKPQRQ
jgi:tetratricopeptide (TPR) repeat protein